MIFRVNHHFPGLGHVVQDFGRVDKQTVELFTVWWSMRYLCEELMTNQSSDHRQYTPDRWKRKHGLNRWRLLSFEKGAT